MSFAVGSNPDAITAGDFNGDSKIDLAASSHGSGKAYVLLGTGTGSFGASTGYAAGANAFHILAADMNNDGKLDLGESSTLTGQGFVAVLLGTGSFIAAANYDVSPSVNVLDAVAGDFNSDGKPDLAFAAGGVSVLLNTGTGS